MPHYLSDEELKRTSPAEIGSFRSPVPTQIVSNGEYNPLPQTARQRQVEGLIKEYAETYGRKQGLSRRRFLRSASGMAVAYGRSVKNSAMSLASRSGSSAAAK